MHKPQSGSDNFQPACITSAGYLVCGCLGFFFFFISIPIICNFSSLDKSLPFCLSRQDGAAVSAQNTQSHPDPPPTGDPSSFYITLKVSAGMISNSSEFQGSLFAVLFLPSWVVTFLPQHLSRLGRPARGRVLNFGPFIAALACFNMRAPSLIRASQMIFIKKTAPIADAIT